MTAGRELDAIIAERFMGWFWIRFAGEPEATCEGKITAFLSSQKDWDELYSGRYSVYMLDDGKYKRRKDGHGTVPEYSTDIAAAWQVVDKMHELGFEMCSEYGFSLKSKRKVYSVWFDESAATVTNGDTAPLAICLAALKACK